MKVVEEKQKQQLKELGSRLLHSLPSNKDSLLNLLKQASACLAEFDQSQSASVLETIQPFLNSFVKPELLKNQDRDVKLLVATCLCEITRITAPNPPYDDDQLKDIFHLIVGTFSGLSDATGPSFGRRVVILETLAKYRSCVVMLDLECHDLVKKMFTTFFAVARDDHQESILSSMQNIMVAVIEESEDVRDDLLLVILSALGRNRNDISAAARRFAMNVIEQCAVKLEAGIKQFLVSSASRENKLENDQVDYHEVIYDIYQCAPQILAGIIPYLTGELLTDQLDTRLKAVGLVGDLFVLPESAVSEMFQPVFSEFLKRLTDRVVTVQMSILDHVKRCLLANPFRAEAPQVLAALCDRLLDYDENVRKQVVDVICNVACHALKSIPDETIKLVAERLRDKSLIVKRDTMERLAEIFSVYCRESHDSPVSSGTFDWIPGKIVGCYFDKDFRSDTIESVLCGSLFPPDFSVKDQAKQWVRFFSLFDKVEVKAFEKILEQKQRLQQEMQRYLSLRQIQQGGDDAEIQKKVQLCFRFMSRLFVEPAKAEEDFQIFDQLKDANIWKIVTCILDPNTGFHQACAARDDLLKILGEKHKLYDFLRTLSMKCSFVLLNKEHVKEILSEAMGHKSDGNLKFAQSCMDILVVLGRFCPSLLCGAEAELVNFLKDDNEVLKEGALHILEKAGGTIREHLPVSSRMEEDPPTSLEQLLPTRKRASDSEVIDSSSLSQPLPHPKKLKIKIKYPSLSVPVASQHQVISTIKQLDSATKCARDMEEVLIKENKSVIKQLDSATKCARDMEEALIKENKSVQLKTIRKEEKRKNILRLIPYAWWKKRLKNGAIVKFQNGVMEEGRTYEVKFAVDKNKKDTKEGEETNNGVPLFRGQEIKRWYQVEGLEIEDECVLEYVDSHTVKYFVFRRKDYPGFSPVPASSSVPTSSSLTLPSTSLVPSTLVATEFTSDLASFKRLFLKDRESGQPISEFPEDLIEHYYRLCLLEKRLIHGNLYETHGAEVGDGLIKKMVLFFKKVRTILSMEVGDVTHEELHTLLVSVSVFQKNELDLGVLGKFLRDVKSVKDSIDQSMMEFEKITRHIAESIDEVLQKE